MTGQSSAPRHCLADSLSATEGGKGGGGAGGDVLEVTAVGARGLTATRMAHVVLSVAGRSVRTRPAARGLHSGPQQLVRFGDWFRLPLAEGTSHTMRLDVVGTRIGGKTVALGSGDVHLPPLLSGVQEEVTCPLTTLSGEFAGEVLLMVKFCPRGPYDEGVPQKGTLHRGEVTGRPVGGRLPSDPGLESDIEELRSSLNVLKIKASQDTAPAPSALQAQMQAELLQLTARVSALEAHREEIEQDGGRWLDEGSAYDYDFAPGPDFESDYTSDDVSDDDYPPDIDYGSVSQGSGRFVSLSDERQSAPLTSLPRPDPLIPPQQRLGPEVGLKNLCSDDEWIIQGAESPIHRPGRRVRILWYPHVYRVQACGKKSRTSHAQWWGGFVSAIRIDELTGQTIAKIHYDDGDVECLNMDDGTTQWEYTNFGPCDVGRLLEVTSSTGEIRRGKVVQSKRNRSKDYTFMNCWPSEQDPPSFVKDNPHVLEAGIRANDNGRFVSDAAVVRFDDGQEETFNLAQENYRWLTDRLHHLPKVGLSVEVLEYGTLTPHWQKGTVISVIEDEGMFKVDSRCSDPLQVIESFTAKLDQCVWRAKETK